MVALQRHKKKTTMLYGSTEVVSMATKFMIIWGISKNAFLSLKHIDNIHKI